jgi:hypothetical protein
MTNQPKAQHGGPRTPGPGKRLGRPPKPDNRLRVVKIRATEEEWKRILSHLPDTRERTEILLSATDASRANGRKGGRGRGK